MGTLLHWKKRNGFSGLAFAVSWLTNPCLACVALRGKVWEFLPPRAFALIKQDKVALCFVLFHRSPRFSFRIHSRMFFLRFRHDNNLQNTTRIHTHRWNKPHGLGDMWSAWGLAVGKQYDARCECPTCA